jgi:hypothetical protein
MKNKILILLIFLISGCSSIPKSDQKESIDTLFKKPEINYKTNSLPKVIKLYYLENNDNYRLPDEIKGFFENLYFYNSKINYQPKIILSPLNSKICESNENIDLTVIFEVDLTNKRLEDYSCLTQLSSTKTLLISNNINSQLRFDNNFIISREQEKEKLVNLISSTKSLVVIDSKKTLDKFNIAESILEKNQRVTEQRTYESELSSQDMFADILMANRSKERLRKLSRRLSREIKGDTRTREDIDTFFLSVSLDEARSLKPALDYIAENELQVFILNSWKNNIPYRLKDKDLIGSINSDIPFMMPIKMPLHLKSSNKTREFAIGYDAFEIMLLRYGTNNNQKFMYKGLTGKINTNNKKITREAYIFKISEEGIEIL